MKGAVAHPLSVSHCQGESALHITHMNTSTNITNTKSPHGRPARGAASSGQGLHDSAAARTGIQQDGETPLYDKLYRGMTSPLRLLPDFLVIGTQRGGTTSLYNYLQTHPCIEPSSTKEIHFFDRRFHRGLGWYRGHFP